MLPIDSVIEPLLQAALFNQTLVVQAPPGAGKTTRIPLLLLEQPWLSGTIILIQPRRLAVLGAARRLAFNLAEPVGKRIGLRTRFDNHCGPQCRIEVVTDGIFLNRIQNDPELGGVSMIIFDEFHERSVNMDLGLAFALEAQTGLRDRNHPLRILVMSATLNGDHLSRWLGAPLIASEGRSFDVETHYRPKSSNLTIEQHLTNLILMSLQNDQGSILVFLPGMKQIRILQRRLEERLSDSDGIDLCPLHASLSPEQQQRAIQPDAPGRRKVVLATNVAETSVTIDGIRIVIDSGLVRAAYYDERRGMDNLVTVAISAASAEQRRGRAGRTQPGVCYRVWSESEQKTKKPYTDAEMLVSDLAPVALQLAAWGNSDGNDLMLLDPPNPDQLQRAQEFLCQLGVLHDSRSGDNKTLTRLGAQVARLGLPPRIGCLIWQHRHSDLQAATVNCAAILSEGDPLRLERDQQQADILLRLEALAADERADPARHTPANQGSFKRLRALQRQLLKRLRQTPQPALGKTGACGLAAALARSFPDRIAQQRQAGSSRYLLSNGKGVQLFAQDPLRQQPYLVVMDCEGSGAEPTVLLACAIQLHELMEALADQITRQDYLYWDHNKQAVVAETQTRLGALIVKQQPLPKPWPERAQQILLQQIMLNQLQDLPWDEDSEQWLARVRWLQQANPDATRNWVDFSVPGLMENADQWLQPYLQNRYRLSDLSSFPLHSALLGLLSWEQQNRLDQLAPQSWSLPTGNRGKLEYASGKHPVLRARIQEFYGLTQHPMLADGTPLTLELLSPAQRPLQITQDLVGFWRGSYQAVAKEMRGRYPKHFWPEDPLTAVATAKTKRAMQQESARTNKNPP